MRRQILILRYILYISFSMVILSLIGLVLLFDYIQRPDLITTMIDYLFMASEALVGTLFIAVFLILLRKTPPSERISMSMQAGLIFISLIAVVTSFIYLYLWNRFPDIDVFEARFTAGIVLLAVVAYTGNKLHFPIFDIRDVFFTLSAKIPHDIPHDIPQDTTEKERQEKK